MTLCNDNGNDSFKCLINKTTTLHICHLHISHNASYLPPKILHNLCFSFLLGITAVPREIENNAYAKFWGANKVHYGRCASGLCIALFGKFIAVLYMTSMWNFIMQGSKEDIMTTQKWQQVTIQLEKNLATTDKLGWLKSTYMYHVKVLNDIKVISVTLPLSSFCWLGKAPNDN